MSKPELYPPIHVYVQNRLIGLNAQNMVESLTEIGRFAGSFRDYEYEGDQFLSHVKCHDLLRSGWRRLRSRDDSMGVTHMETTWVGKDSSWRTTIRAVLVRRIPEDKRTGDTDLGWRARYIELTLDTIGSLLLCRTDHASQDRDTIFHIPSDFHELINTLREKIS